MPTYAQRADHLTLWLDALGRTTLRAAITPSDIRAVLQQWATAGLAPATLNKRRSALMHVWSVLDGKGARNPVRDVPKFAVPDPLPRGRDPHEVDTLLRAAPHCRSRAVCRLMLWTGLRPEEVRRLQPDDVDLEQGILVARTAKGGRARVVPLTSQARDAWREFLAVRAYDPEHPRVKTPKRKPPGHVPHAAPLNRWLQQHTGIPTLRVYDLRHSYGTALARRQTRLDVIGALMGHSTLELTRRYTLAAVTPDAATATHRLARRRAR